MRSTRSSSSDSDSSERVQNVRSVFIRYYPDGTQKNVDESYSYKRKLGDLIFDANFEGGNLGFVERVDQYNYDLMIRPDLTNPRHRLWFNFTVSNQLPNQCVIFNIVNLSDYVRLFHEGLTPVARSRLKPNWVRLHEDQVFYYRSPSHAHRYVLSISFRFSVHDNEHQFALFYPYNYTTLSSFLNRWSIEARRQKMATKLLTDGLSACYKSYARTRTHTPSSMSKATETRLGNLRTLSRLSPDHYTHIKQTNRQHADRHEHQTRSHSSISKFNDGCIPSSSASFSGRKSASPRISTSISKLVGAPAELLSNKKIVTLNQGGLNLNEVERIISAQELYDSPSIDIQPIATTILNKCIYRVSIKMSSRSDSNAGASTNDTSNVSKPNVIIICRQAGNIDTATSFVCQGLIDYLMSSCLVACVARTYINFDFFPMLDPDSVWVGNTRTDLFGQLSGSQRVVRRNSNIYDGFLSVHDLIANLILSKDENKHGKHSNTNNNDVAAANSGANDNNQSQHHKPHHWTDERKQKQFTCLRKTTSSPSPTTQNPSSTILIDLQVNMSLIGSRVIGTSYNEPLRMERHLSFPRLLSQFSEDFYFENSEFHPSIDSVPSGLFDFRERHLVDQYRFEISPFASFKRSLTERTYDELSPQKYFALSKAIIFALVEMAKPKQLETETYLDEMLKAFHQGPSDIDDLKLNLGEFE